MAGLVVVREHVLVDIATTVDLREKGKEGRKRERGGREGREGGREGGRLS